MNNDKFCVWQWVDNIENHCDFLKQHTSLLCGFIRLKSMYRFLQNISFVNILYFIEAQDSRVPHKIMNQL